MKRIFFLCMTLVFTASLVAFTPAPAGKLEDDVISYTNKYRKSKGLSALTLNEELSAIAETHSINMAKGKVSFGHGGFNTRYGLAKQKIKNFKGFAENVLYGADSGKEAVELWKKSTGHRNNMLGDYKYIGIGTARDKQGRIYYTQVFAR